MKKQITTIAIMSVLFACTQQARAESPLLKQGIEDYNNGDYANAVGHLGQSLSQEFGNPVMHYYMGNAYVHLRERDAAIREFRIAFALDPKSKVGELAKKALHYMRVDDETSSRPIEKPRVLPQMSQPPVDRHLDKAVNSLQDQANRMKNQHTRDAQMRADDIGRYGQGAYQRAKSEIDDNLTYYRRGRMYKLPMPADASALLDRLQQMYGSQKATSLNDGLKRAEEIQNSAENLNSLLHDNSKKSGPRLVPAGTNLYIRNYQAPSKPPEQKPAAAASTAATASTASAASTSTAASTAAPQSAAPSSTPRVEEKVEGKIAPP